VRWLCQQYIDLILFRAYAGLRAESSRNYLSFAWWVLDPILSMGTYYLVFQVLFTGNRKDYVPFLLIGLVIWQWFANSINHCTNSILHGGGLMNQTNLPAAIFPSTVLVIDMTKFLLVFSLLLLFLLIYGYSINYAWLMVPFLLIIELILIAGCGFLIAAIIPFVPDIKFLVEALLHLMLFVSGVFYSGEIIPERFQYYFYLNPIVILIDAHRNIFMHYKFPHLEQILYVLIVSSIIFLGSNWLLTKTERAYPKIVG
jgi:lipopolysaccharide transport system permease protein